MAIAQPNTESQPFGLAQACIKGLTDDDDLDGLGDLISGHAAQIPEKRRNVTVTKKIRKRKLNNLLDVYETYLRIEGIPQMEFVWRNIDDKIVLTPIEINAFLQMTREFEDCNISLFSEGVGYFITSLIQNSYNAGYNNFIVDTSNLKETLNKVGWFIKGTPEKPIKIKVVGDLGDDCFNNSQHVNCEAYGNVGKGFGNQVLYSYFKIDGDADEWCGHNAGYSYFFINGKIKEKCSYRARSSSFVIKGDAVIDIYFFSAENSSYQFDAELNGHDLAHMGKGCTNCEFLTSNRRTLKKLLESEIKKGDSNKIYFINANGTKKLVRGD